MDIHINLRSLELNDIDEEYCEWYKNEDGHLDYFSGTGKHFNKHNLINDFKEGLASKRWFYYIIEDLSAVRIGNIKIGPIDLKNKTSDLVCFIGNRNFLGKKIAAKAIKMANCIAFDKYQIRRLQGGMHSYNIPSIKAYTSAGWFVEGIFKGYYLVDGNPVDRVSVACLNPKYFP